MKLTTITLFFLTAMAVFASAQPTWTSTDGRTITADFVRLHNGEITLRMNSQEYTIPITRLDEASRKQAFDQAAATFKPFTAEEVKNYWLKNMPPLPSTLDREFHPKKKANEKREKDIKSGKFDGAAGDEALRLNIDALVSYGRPDLAEVYRRQLEARLQARAQAQAAATAHDAANRVRSELEMLRIEVERLRNGY